jgi:hypothetical protein
LRCNALRAGGCIRAVRGDVQDARQCAALRCTVRGLFAMQCAARGLVAFARCRRRHAFDGGIFRVGGEGLRYGLIGGQREKVRGEYGFVESLTLLSQRLNARRERVL